MSDVVDVAVIGGGVVGCAVARHLAGFDLSVVLLEARGDVGDVTSKANTAILHTGFDAVPGSLESRLVAQGYSLLSEYAPRAGIPVEHTGALLVAWTPEEVDALPYLRDKAVANGYAHCQIVDAAAVYAAVPALGPGALSGLTVPDESIICPWTTTLAYATEAQERGARLLMNHSVSAVDVRADVTVLSTTGGDVSARWVINAAGLGADILDAMYGYQRFTVVPRRGELLVFDKLSRSLVNTIVLPVPSSRGKGVLVSPTIYGNVMLGPTSENLTDRADTSTSEDGFAFLLGKGRIDVNQRYVLLGGIRSTGLTASMALALHVEALLADAGVRLESSSPLPDTPVLPNIGEAFPRPYEQPELIAADPQYGDIVCFCERVSRGEIRDALGSAVPPCDLDGLRRRTRAMMGRCQGFFCGAEVDSMMRESGR